MTEHNTLPAADIADPARVRELLAEAREQQAVAVERVQTLEAVLAVLEGRPVAAKGASRPLLTRRQRDVAQLIAEGKPNAAIASKLGMSENTVRIHVSAVLKALGLSNRTEAALWWLEHGAESTHAKG